MLSILLKFIKHAKTQSQNPELRAGLRGERSHTKKPQVIQILELVEKESNYD